MSLAIQSRFDAMTDAEKLQHLAGDVSGLRMVIMALLNAQPNPTALLAQVDRLSELQIGVTAATAVSDAFLKGQDDAIAAVRAHLLEIVQRGT
jgi:hypothetical protein